MAPPHRRRRAAVALALVALLAAGAVPIVQAHANLVDATPGNGEQVDEPPDEVELRYSEGVQVATVTVTDTDGERVDVGNATVDGADPVVVHVPLQDVGNDTYTVTWEVLSVDGHTTSGSFVFVVGEEFPDRDQLLGSFGDDGGADGGPGLVEPVARSLLFTSIVVLVGVPVTLLAVVAPVLGGVGVGRDRLRRIVLGGSILAAGSLAAFVAARLSGGPTSVERLGRLGSTAIARVAVAQAVLLVGLLAVALLPYTRYGRATDRPWLAGVAGLGALVGLGLSWLSHSAAVVGPVGVAVDWTHLLGAAAWVGGLAGLVAVTPALADRSDATAAALVRRFSVLAMAGVGLATATGFVLASWHVPTAGSLAGTSYGGILVGKVALVTAAVALGAVNRFLVHPVLAGRDVRDGAAALPGGLVVTPDRAAVRRWLRWTVRVELAILLLVLPLTGVLTAVPTAVDAETGTEAPPSAGDVAEAGALTLDLRVVPARTGLNVVDARFSRNGTAVDAEEDVELLLRNRETGTELPQETLDPHGTGHYTGVVSFPAAGEWEVRVSTWIDGEFVAERVTVEIESGTDESTADAGGTPDGPFPRGLRVAGVATGVLTLVAVGRELLALRR